MKPTITQYNFCHLTGITQEQYQTALFETGYLYAELYWSKNLPSNWQKLARIMRETKEYWKWWTTQWNIRTQEAFGIVGINENEKQISMDESDALFEAFMESHNLKSYEFIYPNKLVFIAFKEKLHENRFENTIRENINRNGSKIIKNHRKSTLTSN
jgi:hypothetical protein